MTRRSPRVERLEERLAPSAVPVGPEFRVNTHTTNGQLFSALARDADGDFVIAWQSNGQDGSGEGVYAQRYDAVGAPQGVEFRVNTYTTGGQQNVSVAMDADGDFVVTWTSAGQDGSGFGVYAQRYNAAGARQGSEFRINTFTTGNQLTPAVGVDADGDFVIAWTSQYQDGSLDGVFVRRYTAAGVPQGPEFRVNTHTANQQRIPAVGMDADGDFVVAWESDLQDGDRFGIYAQRYSAAGVPQGVEFRVNTFTTRDQIAAAVGMDADGDFVLAWASEQDGSGFGVYTRRYSAAGRPLGVELRANTFTTGFQTNPALGMDADGDFVVAWQSGQDGSGTGIYAQAYVFPDVISLSGTGGDDTVFLTDQGAELQVTINATTTSYPWASLASLTIDTGAGIDVVWQQVPSVPAGVTIHLNGGADLDVLVSPAVATTWTIMGVYFGQMGSRVHFSGMDHLYGDAADDTFVMLPAGFIDFLWGGLGTNRVDYSAYTADVTVILGNNPGGYDCFPFSCGQATASTYGLGAIQNVTAGSGNDILVGDYFGNALQGGGGRDLLIGGGDASYTIFHADDLDGGAGDDIVLGGFTDYDANPTALEAIRASWTRPAVDYFTRVNDLTSGTGVPRLDATTVHSNHGANTLRGGADRDLFFGDPAFDTTDLNPFSEVFVPVF